MIDNADDNQYYYVPYDASFIISSIDSSLELKDKIKDFKYIDKNIHLNDEIDILIKKCIDLDTKENIKSQLSTISNLYDKLYKYNKKKISEEVSIVNFDKYYSIVYDDNGASCQNALNQGYLCNHLGIWLHHNWASFMRLFNSLSVGSIAIINGTKYKVVSVSNGYANTYAGYFFNNGVKVPEYTNRYMVTCWGFDYGDTWGIRIIEFAYA